MGEGSFDRPSLPYTSVPLHKSRTSRYQTAINHPFCQISKIRKKTPKFANFLHFTEFSFGFGEDNYKRTDFLPINNLTSN